MNILLIVVDTLRADHLSAYGYARDTSPHLRGLAAQGVRFEQFFAHNNTTHPSFTTLMTGRHPLNHGIVGHMGTRHLAPDVPVLASVLRERGYATAAVDNLGRWFSRGFDTYVPYQFDQRATTPMYSGDEVTALAAPLLDHLSHGEQPFFLFVHYWDPHSPYLPPAPYDTLFDPADGVAAARGALDDAYRFTPLAPYLKGWIGHAPDVASVIARYDGEVAYADRCVGALLDRLDGLGRRDDTVVAVTADHGESLGEHGIYFDHHGLYTPSLHVPLVLRCPGIIPSGVSLPGLARHIDLAPTLLDLAGLPGALPCEGASLRAHWAAPDDSRAIPDTLLACESSWQAKIALRARGWTLIHALEADRYGTPPVELYDLAADPAETCNLAAERPDVVDEMTVEQDRLVAGELALGGLARNPMLDERTTLISVLASQQAGGDGLREAVVDLLRERGQLATDPEAVYSAEEEALIEERLSNLGYL